MFLDKIITLTRERVREEAARTPISHWEGLIADLPPVRGFQAALRAGSPPRVIAELKKASPSRGLIRAEYDPAALARAYYQGGAAALSVLTEEAHFQGHPRHLALVREAVPLPLLRKDFLIDPWQLYQSRALGADAVLLIVAVLGRDLLEEFLKISRQLGLETLVEVHDQKELELALAVEAPIIGINNRDLSTFQVNLATTRKLAALVPPERLLVSESGISAPADLAELKGLGVGALLVGEALMSAPDPGAKLRELIGRKE